MLWKSIHSILLSGCFMLCKWHSRSTYRRYPVAPLLVIFIVVLLYIPFRAVNFDHFIVLSKSLFQIHLYSVALLKEIILDFSMIRFSALLFIFALFTLIEAKLKSLDFSEWISSKNSYFRYTLYYLLVSTILLLGNFDVKPYFIYFQF